MKAHKCTVLAIDPGALSGVALFHRGRLIDSDTVDTGTVAVEQWATMALSDALRARQTLVVVGETWGKGGPMGMAQWQGLGSAWAIWKRAVDLAWKRAKSMGHKQPSPKFVRVHVSKWRAGIYGHRIGKGMAKQLAVRTANLRHRLRLEDGEHDRAEAVLLGEYGTLAQEVGAVIPERFR